MTAQQLGLTALITHARHVPSEAREEFVRAASLVADNAQVVLFRTCHRVELYARTATGAGRCALPPLPAGGRRLDDDAALHHLFEVAAGLDSVVIGEDQILHQLRDCLAAWHRDARAPLDPLLDRALQMALHLGRQARAWREGAPRSLADVALDRACAQSGSLAGRDVLIVGAGRMARLLATAAVRRGARVTVTNRSPERAAELATRVGGDSIPFGTVGPNGVGAIFVAVAGRWTVDPAHQAALALSTAGVFDLSSPPAAGPELRASLGPRFVSVDDMAAPGTDEGSGRFRRRVERLLSEAEAEFTRWAAARTAVPAIHALTDLAERHRIAEVDRLLRRLPDLDAHERELVEQMSRRLVGGLLHAPLSVLGEDDSGERERVARELFAL